MKTLHNPVRGFLIKLVVTLRVYQKNLLFTSALWLETKKGKKRGIGVRTNFVSITFQWRNQHRVIFISALPVINLMLATISAPRRDNGAELRYNGRDCRAIKVDSL